MIHGLQSRLNPEDVLADSPSDFAQHRTSPNGIAKVSVPPTRGNSFIYDFHILGHLDPSYHPIAKSFYDVRNAMFIVDLAKLETTDPLTGMPYITAQLDLFARCVTPPTCFFRRAPNLFLFLINYDSVKAKLANTSTTASPCLSRTCPDFQPEDLSDFREHHPQHETVLQYLFHRYSEIANRESGDRISFFPYIVPTMMDEWNVSFFLPAIQDVVLSQSISWACTMS